MAKQSSAKIKKGGFVVPPHARVSGSQLTFGRGAAKDADAARETVEKNADEAYATRAEFEVQLTPRKDLAGGWKAKSRMLTIKEARARAAKRAWVKDGADRKKA